MTNHPQLIGNRLIVDGQPFTILGAELHNSSSSTPSAIRRSFARAAQLGANAVLAPVAWDLLEPAEGTYDFMLVDTMIDVARSENLRLIPLWFGAWKNAVSTYVPAWVKRDATRFPRAETRESGRIEHLSPFCDEARDADARAFRALMAHILEIDGAQGTTLMVQVENEVGLLGDSRDRSAGAETAWTATVPTIVVDAVAQSNMPVRQSWTSNGSRTSGNWADLFGDGADADELFMAWAYATHIESVAAAGRAENPLPLFVNTWLDSVIEYELPDSADPAHPGSGAPAPPDSAKPEVAMAGGMQPGSYPSGGPVLRVAPVWQACAPTLDFLAPDVYFGNFDRICAGYQSVSGSVFIPEMRRSPEGVGQMFVAIGQYGAIGVSPFGVDSVTPGSSEEAALRDGYRLLHAATALIQTSVGQIAGFQLTAKAPETTFIAGDYTVAIRTQDPYGLRPPTYPAYGIVVEEAPGKLVIIGRGFVASFTRDDGQQVGVLSATELDYDRHSWSTVHRLNGDETSSGTAIPLPALDALPSFFPIPQVTTSTGVIRVELYSY